MTQNKGSAQSKIAVQRAAQQRRRRRQRTLLGGSAGVALAAATALVVALWPTSTSSSAGTSEPTPLAPRGAVTGSPVDGIGSGTMEQLAFHIHAHVAIYAAGRERLVPAGIGIVGDGAAFYWLHTHDESGIIHMEAPMQRGFTLGELFDMWGQPLSATQVGPALGSVTVLVNGTAVGGDPRTVPLDAHAVIQLDVGTPVPFRPYSFPAGL
jgi:hypothetical protein